MLSLPRESHALNLCSIRYCYTTMPLRELPLTTPNAELLPEDVPVASSSGDDNIQRFCHSFDGYDYWGDADICHKIGSDVEKEIESGRSPRYFSLARLRTLLFFAARRLHWADTFLDSELFDKVADAIREKLVQGDENGESMADRMCLFNRALCQQMVERTNQLSEADEVSAPLLIKIPALYESARIRVVMIGQETNGWGDSGPSTPGPSTLATMQKQPTEETALFLEDLYEKFLNERKGKPSRRPFFQGINQLMGQLGNRQSYVWTNLFPSDHGNKPPQGEMREWLLDFRVLAAQISILEPNVVIFLTGPNRDDVVQKLFKGATFTALRDKRRSQLAKISGAAGLPAASYRTYHPAYLRRSKQWELLDIITKDILGNPHHWNLYGPDENQPDKPPLTGRKSRFVDDSLNFLTLGPRRDADQKG